MSIRRAAVLAIAAAGSLAGSLARADQPYFYDVLKQKPYHAAWNVMFKGEKKVDPWIVTFGKSYDGVSDQIKTLTVDGQNDILGWVCKPHDCGNNQLYVLFTPNAGTAWGLLVTDKGMRWFGKPDDSVKSVLTQASKEKK